MAVHLAVERTRWAWVTTGVVALLAVANVMSNRVLPSALYVPWNVAVAIALVALAVRVVSLRAMGLGEWRRGLAWGLTILVLTIIVLTVAVAMPVFNDLYHDKRVSHSFVEMAYQALVRIPLGTALLEEIAFRAVLPALFAARWGVLRGCVLASVCFGLWHVLPALGLNKVNPTANSVFGNGAGGVTIAVAFAVVGTMIGGLFWCWIRYRARSVLATMLAHVATNSVGYVIAWFVAR
ncbi:MAG: CPBP family intramembrane glutamic endopeptidase [Ilumatobacteraceae bacterium]